MLSVWRSIKCKCFHSEYQSNANALIQKIYFKDGSSAGMRILRRPRQVHRQAGEPQFQLEKSVINTIFFCNKENVNIKVSKANLNNEKVTLNKR